MAIHEGSFKEKSLKDLFFEGKTKGLPNKIEKIKAILDYINKIDELPPKRKVFRVHEHAGSGKGTWSFDLTGNMRILCEFDENIDPTGIRIEDPH